MRYTILGEVALPYPHLAACVNTQAKLLEIPAGPQGQGDLWIVEHSAQCRQVFIESGGSMGKVDPNDLFEEKSNILVLPRSCSKWLDTLFQYLHDDLTFFAKEVSDRTEAGVSGCP